jgi:signal transduction histidine kinase
MLILNDITHSVTFDVLKQNDEYKNSLLATVSHDLKNPLNAIISLIDVSTDSNNIETIKRANNIVKKSAEMLLNLINDIVGF